MQVSVGVKAEAVSLDRLVEVLEETKVSEVQDANGSRLTIGTHPQLGQVLLLNSAIGENLIVRLSVIG